MSEQPRPAFRGSSPTEAEEFVQSVRQKAWEARKGFDYSWMAAYAAAQMSGPALRWHMGLPRDVQGDWGKLEVALLDRFAPDQPPAAPSSNPIVPSGASAVPVTCVGRLRIVTSDTGRFVGYVPKKITEKNSAIEFTTNVGEALAVQFTPSSSLITFDLVDKSTFHRLALQLWGNELELKTADKRRFYPTCFATGLKPGTISYSHPTRAGTITHVQHSVWKVDTDGSITPVWPPSPQVEISAMVYNNYKMLEFWSNPNERMKNEWTRDNCKLAVR